ncbi:hypothetical protein D0907_16385 (plasmid) [Pseudoalteromonas lipolytica]|uniref:Uncharacterized protein n=1 Tax=Pseudoalteromonas lipolytica TaxID=570156 RepID=A0AAD0WDW4_9GAMM|nr:hypothetical protein D0907_16385 [Pseudoalteromonas donghaensis]
MARHVKFRAILLALVVCIIGFNFILIGGLFYQNLFYSMSFLFALLLIVRTFNYVCPNCKRSQVMRSFFSYRLPSKNCYSCGHDLESKKH